MIGLRYQSTMRGSLAVLLGVALLVVAACAPKIVPPPPITWPSRVVTQEGMAYYVRGLRLPGNRQELSLKEGGTQTWLSLSQILNLRFTGPERERYRPAEITLISGDKIRGELFVGQLVEGTTDLGYWNMPLKGVERLEMGTE
jgi:hypothetical protein